MSVPNPASFWVPKFCDPLRSPLWHNVRKYASHLDASRFTDMRASDHSLTVWDLHNVLRDIEAGVWVKRCLHCGGRSMLVSCWVCSEVDCSLVYCYEEVKYENYLSTLGQRSDGKPFQEIGLSLVVLRRTFSPLYAPLHFNCWEHNWKFDVFCISLLVENLISGIVLDGLQFRRLIARLIISRFYFIGKNWKDLVHFAFWRTPSLHITTVTLQNIILVRIWLDAMRRHSLL